MNTLGVTVTDKTLKDSEKRKVISHFYRARHLIGQLFVLVVMRNNITGNHLLSLSLGIICLACARLPYH
jgi:hypothetical protein